MQARGLDVLEAGPLGWMSDDFDVKVNGTQPPSYDEGGNGSVERQVVLRVR